MVWSGDCHNGIRNSNDEEVADVNNINRSNSDRSNFQHYHLLFRNSLPSNGTLPNVADHEDMMYFFIFINATL